MPLKRSLLQLATQRGLRRQMSSSRLRSASCATDGADPRSTRGRHIIGTAGRSRRGGPFATQPMFVEFALHFRPATEAQYGYKRCGTCREFPIRLIDLAVTNGDLQRREMGTRG